MMPLVPLLLGIAPTVASWILGDKTGGAVEKVSGIAREILGTDDPSGIEAAIMRDPNLALQFKMAVIHAEADARRHEHEEVLARLADIRIRPTAIIDIRIDAVRSARCSLYRLVPK